MQRGSDVTDADPLPSIASAILMGQGAYNSPEEWAAAVIKRLDHDGFRILPKEAAKMAHPCSDCVGGYCTMNCGPAQRVTTRDALVMNLRGLGLRMQFRVEAIEDRDGKVGAVTGRGVGIGYLLARDLGKNLTAAADMLEGGAEAGTACLSGMATGEPCKVDAANLRRCTICGFVIDTKYEAEKPTAKLRP